MEKDLELKLQRPIKPIYTEMFSGKVFRICSGGVAIRNHSGEATHTIITVPGFLENHCYFTHTYHDDPSTELILMTCSNYHIPVSGTRIEKAPWAQPCTAKPATIACDAEILLQILKHLPSTNKIRIHGHSRGSAVILEAARQKPKLFQQTQIVLEAPLLPQTKAHPMITTIIEPLTYNMLPWIIRLLKKTPINNFGKGIFGHLTPRKKKLLEHMYNTPKDILTIAHNIEDIRHWVTDTSLDIYRHLPKGYCLIAERERILDRETMMKSIFEAADKLTIIETKDTSHFITLDNPECLPDF